MSGPELQEANWPAYVAVSTLSEDEEGCSELEALRDLAELRVNFSERVGAGYFPDERRG